MGRKKKPQAMEEAPREEEEEVEARGEAEDSDSSDFEVERGTYDIDPEIQELAGAFGIDVDLTQRLNDIMIEDRHRTWKQDLDRLYEILRDAHTPAAMLNLKLRDMERGKFVGKAKCGPKVRELVRKHRLDKGASTKLEEAISMREAMGKDIEKDLQLLDEHLQASNAPSKLISMKLESLRKGFNIGHCIFSRETLPGNQGPGVDGVFNKKEKGRPLGYTDADLDRRFSENQGLRGGGGQLMDEATVRRMIAAERKQHEAKQEKQKRSRSDSQGRERRRSPSRAKRRRSPSESPKRKRARSQSCSRSRKRSPKGKATRNWSASRGRK